jgi:hypothetical protein
LNSVENLFVSLAHTSFQKSQIFTWLLRQG